MRILDHLIQTLRSAANHNGAAQAAPACILWPDHDRQWQSAIPALQAALPELFVLGQYDPATRMGPAIWLRCVLSGVLPPSAEPPVRGELSAADRLTGLLAAAYGDAWRASKLDALLAAAGWAGKSLDSWLRTQFFADHCKLFHQRPFLWHVWDGLPDGFAALVNYHQLDRKRLEILLYIYVGDWMSRQRRDAAAATLQQRLELILHGEAPYDIFVHWKALEQQPIGWEPDLNDGVRLNIRPWLRVPDVGKKGAGVLRDRPNIQWEKDRGKDVVSAPWYGVFGGERINDWHVGVEEKRAARAMR